MDRKQREAERGAAATSLEEAREFLDERDGGTKVFEVEWTWKVTWQVAAASKEEAEKAAQEVSDQELRDCQDNPDLYVSNDLTEQARKLAEKTNREVRPPEADSGVFEGEILAVNEYIAQRIWHLIVDVTGGQMECPVCGHEDWTSEFNRNPEPPKYGHIPILGCPECKAFIDWVRVVGEKEKVADDQTMPLFEEKGEADGDQPSSRGVE